MKSYILLLILFVSPVGLTANYVVDFNDPTTYQVTCGTVNPSQWTVSASTCELYLPPMVLAKDTFVNVDYLFRINQSGNLFKSDYLSLEYRIGLQGAWVTDTTIIGSANNNVRDIHGTLPLNSGDTLYFRIIAFTRTTSGFWSVKSGDIEIDGVTPVNFPLPIELAEFKGYHNEDEGANILQWTTLSELNNSHFVIEKSTDGVTFNPITVLSGAGTSNIPLTYEYLDETVASDSYYRLTQYDFDGKWETFSPILVEYGSSSPEPNIIDNAWIDGESLQLITSADNEGPLMITLLDINGRILMQKNLIADPLVNHHLINIELMCDCIMLLDVQNSKGARETIKIITL